MDDKDIEEILTLSATLEGLACEIVLNEGKLGPDDLEHLEGFVEQQREAVKIRDFDRLTQLDMDFH